MFLQLFLCFGFSCCCALLFSLYLSSWLNLLVLSTSWYRGIAFRNVVWSADIPASLLLMPSGTASGWLLLVLIYCGLFSGFRYGSCFSVFRLNITSRKFTIFLFASIAIFRLFFPNVLQVFFFIFSIACGLHCDTASPSSLYRSSLASPSSSLSCARI